MKQLEFYIVDVFAEKRYAGNQLAVFIVDDVNDDIGMQQMAREINFSETTFACPRPKLDGGYDVRIFTPGHEVPFAGHPSLGTTHILRQVAKTAPDPVLLNLKVGQIPVSAVCGDAGHAEDTVYWMRQNEPEFGPNLAVEALAPVLGLEPQDIDERYPVQQVSTGLAHIIVPLRGLDALQKIRLNVDRYWELINTTWAKNILVFSPETHEPHNTLSVRMFAPYLGIAEDPATGSGNGCLAGYLVKHRYFGTDSIDIRVEQGYAIGRPSLLYLKSERSSSGTRVEVGGRAVTVARGLWQVD